MLPSSTSNACRKSSSMARPTIHSVAQPTSKHHGKGDVGVRQPPLAAVDVAKSTEMGGGRPLARPAALGRMTEVEDVPGLKGKAARRAAVEVGVPPAVADTWRRAGDTTALTSSSREAENRCPPEGESNCPAAALPTHPSWLRNRGVAGVVGRRCAVRRARAGVVVVVAVAVVVAVVVAVGSGVDDDCRRARHAAALLRVV